MKNLTSPYSTLSKEVKSIIIDNVFMGLDGYAFNFLELSDVHINHPFVGHDKIIDLLSFLLNPTLLTKLHRIYIAGDFYDHGMEYTEVEKVSDIEYFQKQLLLKCKKYDVQVRILEGTRSHDRYQSNHFIKINRECNIGCDVKYFDKLTVEIDERYGDSTLYIPDQWKVDASETYREALAELTKKGLTKADFGCGHGSYKYQMQKHLRSNISLHDEVLHSELVNYAFFVGHHHNSSNSHKVYCSGSPQRLRFGEEEDKGYYEASVIGGKINIDFKVLHDAIPLITIKCPDLPAEEIMVKLNTLIDKYPDTLGVRLMANKSDPAAEVVRYYSDMYPHLFFKFEEIKTKEKKQLPTVELKSTINTAKSLTKNNLADLIRQRIKNKLESEKSTELTNYLEHVDRVIEDIFHDISA